MTLRHALRFALATVLSAAPFAAAETTYLPGAAEVTGLAGARFSSTLELTNPGATGATVTIGLVPMAGKAAPAPATRTLAAEESVRIPEALKTLFGLADGAAGTITVTSEQPLLASLTTRNVAAVEGAYGLGLLAVPESELLGAGETGHSIWVSQSADPSAGYRTNLSVTLVDPGTVVEVRVLDAEGRVAGTATVTAASPEVWQQPASAIAGAADLPVGRAEFEVKSGRATAYAVVNDNVTSDAIALQAERVFPGATDSLISGAALSPGHLGSFWSTDLRLFNPGSAPLEATVLSVGAPSEANVKVPVPAKGVVEVARVLALLGFPEGTASALRVRATEPLLVAARTNNADPAGVRKGTFSAQQYVTRWPLGLLGAGAVGFFNGIDQTLNVPGARTNLAVVGGPEGAAGELVLRDAAGVEQGRAPFTRGPGEWGQLGVADWFAASPSSASSLGGLALATIPENARIDVAVGSGAVDAFISRIDNGSGDAVTRPVALPGGGDCSKVAISSFEVAPLPVTPGAETTFTWSVAVEPPTPELTSQSIRFDGGEEIPLDKDARAYTRTFASTGPGTVTLTVRRGNCVKTRALSFFVCGDLSIEPASLPSAIALDAFGPELFSAAGATSPVDWSVTAGALPGGLELSASGTLAGEPSEIGNFAFTVTAVDANGCEGSRAYTLDVDCPTLRISPTTLPSGTVAVPYGPHAFSVSGGSGTGTWSATGLPGGLAISAKGVLSGTPAASGSFPAEVRYRDALGCDETVTVTIVICNPLTVGPASPPNATAGSPYAQTFTAAGSSGVPSFAVTAGALPAGLTLAPATGLLSGTPTATGTFVFTVRATDELGCTGTVPVTLVVDCPAIVLAPATLVDAIEDQSYSATVTQTGGAPATTTFAITAGALPAGVTLTPAGALSGTATVPGTYDFTVTATDASIACTGFRAYSLVVTPVNDAPSFTKGADVTVLEDSAAYSAAWATAISAGPADESAQVLTFNVTGNTNPALFSVPPAVSPTGVLSFTPAPNASGSASITLTLSDDGGTANGGVDTSAAQVLVVTVTDVNDAPSFTKGPDVTVLEDSAAYSAAWAPAVSPGPAAESGQVLTFNVTGNTNAALFLVGPSVSPAGVLSFTPAPNANGAATITLSLSDDGGTANGGVDTSATQTFVVTLTPVNDAPSFTKGADVTVLEDSAAYSAAWATALSAGPADESGQVLAFNVTGNTNPALFTVPPAVSPTGVLSFTLAPNASGSATVTFTLSDDGGTADGGVDTSAAQVLVVTVTDVNDAPSFTKGSDVTVLEDAGPQTVDPWATGISAGAPSESGQVLTFNVTGNTNPGLFASGPSVSPAGVLTFTPAANANGSATVTLTLSDNGGTANGGVETSASQVFVVNVTAVNDAPSFTKGANQTVFDNSGPQTVAGWATAISKGPADESAQTLTFNVTGNDNPGFFSAGPSIDPSGTLTYTPNPSTGGTATITITLSDSGGTANGGADTSAPQVFTITFSHVNVAPSFTKGADETVNEDAGPQSVAGWATAISPGPPVEAGQTLVFNVTGNTNPALFSVPPAISPTGVLTYTPAANAFGTATITITLSDDGGTADGGADTSAPQSFVITVNAVNDAPSFTKGADDAVNEDAGPRTVAGWATAISAGPASESGQLLTFNVTGNTDPGLFSAGPAISPAGDLTYTPAANASGTATITITLSDDGGTANGGVDTSAPQLFVITITGVNDPPSFLKGPDQTVDEDAGPQTVDPWATAVSAGPPSEAGQLLTFTVTNISDPALFSVPPAVSSTGVLTYTSAPNAHGTATITLTLQDNGGTANGGIDASAAQTFVITVNPVNDPPTFANATVIYATPGNTQLHAGGATLAGVVSVADALGATAKSLPGDVDGPGPLVVVAASGASTESGSFAIAADGSFTYVPAPGFTGTDTFTYQVSDQAGMTPGIAVGTVSVTVGPVVWYIRDVVDGNNAAGGDGRSTNAFDTIAAFNAATTADGDVIFVFRGNTGTTALSGGITLRNGQKLWGEGIGLTVAPFGTLVAAGLQPRISNGSGDAVSVPATAGNREDVEIRGLDLAGSVNAIDVTASGGNLVGVTITNNTVSGAGAEGIDLNAGSTGAVAATVSNNTVTATGNGIDARVTAVGTATVTAAGNTITSTAGNAFDARTQAGASALRVAFDSSNVTAGGSGIVIDGSAAGTTTITSFSGNSVNGNTTGTGISVTSAVFDGTAGGTFQTIPAGTTVVGASGNGVGGAGVVLTNVQGDLSFADLDVFADGGAGLRASSPAVYTGSAGLRIVVPAGLSIVEATGGPAIDLTQATVTLPLSSLRSTNSPTTGVALNSVAGTFSAGSGSTISNITSAAGTAFQVGASSATVTYAGTIATTQGKGVDLTGNSGTIGFTGTLTLSSGTNAAFNATGGGTVTATDTASTLTTTTGTALNVANTTIGAGGLKFRSISSNGAASGIVLNTTGATGSLAVLGNGGACTSSGTCTGGAIVNTTGAGISLTSTLSPSFDRIFIQNTARSGITGTGVSNFTLTNSRIDNSGTAAAGQYLESSVAFNDGGAFTTAVLTGTVTITGNTFLNARRHGIQIENGNGTISSLLIQNNTLTSSTSSAASLGTAILVLQQGSAATSAHLTTGTISGNAITNFPSGEGIAILGGSGNSSNNTSSTLGANGTPISITGNSISGQAAAAQHLGSNAIRASFNGQVGVSNFSITNNGTVGSPITNIQGQGISVFMGGSVTGTTTISNNVIVANQTLLAGTQGLAVQVDDGPAGLGTSAADYNFVITNNSVSAYEGFGIRAIARASLGKMDLTIQNNTVGAPIMTNRNGIRVDSGSAVGDVNVCLLMTGNTSAGSGVNQGIGLRKQGTVATTNDFGISGLAPSPTTGANAALKVAADNPAGSGVDIISGDNFVNCTPN